MLRNLLSLFTGAYFLLGAVAQDANQSVLGQVGQYKNALLFTNGKQTLCSIAVATESYGLVAANCLKFSSGTTVDMSPKYQVSISGTQKAFYGTFDITKVTVHPKYDASTQANNIAIVYFNASSKGKFTNAVADWPAEWKSYYFVHQSQTNDTKPAWNAPIIAVTDTTADSGNCAKLSALYGKNQADLICTQVTAPTYAVKGCVAPFGSMYGVSSSNLALGALFSHSETSGGTGLCSKGQVYSYFTVLRNYLAWVSKEVGGQVPVLHGTDSKYTAPTNAEYAMSMSQTSSPMSESDTSSSASSTSSTSVSQSAATAALIASLVTVTITAPAPTIVSTTTTTLVSTSVLTVTPVPSILFVTMPPVTQTIFSTITSTVTNVVTTVISISAAEPTSSATFTPPPQPSSKPSTSESKLSSTAIAAIVLGILLLLALLAYLFIRRRRQQRQAGYAASEKGHSGTSRVRWWFFNGGNSIPRTNSPPLIPHEAPHY